MSMKKGKKNKLLRQKPAFVTSCWSCVYLSIRLLSFPKDNLGCYWYWKGHKNQKRRVRKLMQRPKDETNYPVFSFLWKWLNCANCICSPFLLWQGSTVLENEVSYYTSYDLAITSSYLFVSLLLVVKKTLITFVVSVNCPCEKIRYHPTNLFESLLWLEMFLEN